MLFLLVICSFRTLTFEYDLVYTDSALHHKAVDFIEFQLRHGPLQLLNALVVGLVVFYSCYLELTSRERTLDLLADCLPVIKHSTFFYCCDVTI